MRATVARVLARYRGAIVDRSSRAQSPRPRPTLPHLPFEVGRVQPVDGKGVAPPAPPAPPILRKSGKGSPTWGARSRARARKQVGQVGQVGHIVVSSILFPRPTFRGRWGRWGASGFSKIGRPRSLARPIRLVFVFRRPIAGLAHGLIPGGAALGETGD